MADADAPEPSDFRPPSAPPGATRPRRRSGCLFWAIGLPVVAVVGIALGVAASGGDDEGPAEDRVTLAEGGEDGGWRVEAVRDVDGQTCAFIYLGDRQSTGGCDTTAQDDTLDDGRVTVVFGRAPARAARVRVPLTGADPVEVDTVTAAGMDGRFYVTRVPGDVDTAGVPEVVGP